MADWPQLADQTRFYTAGHVPASTHLTQAFLSGSGVAVPGQWVIVAASGALPFDAQGFYLNIGENNSSAGFIDVAVGSPEQVILDNFIYSYPRAQEGSDSVYIPLAIPAGTQVSVRVAASGGGTGYVRLGVTFAAGGFYGAPGLGVSRTYGVDLTTGKGTLIPAPGSTHTKHATAVTITGALTDPISAFILAIGMQGTGSRALARYLIDVYRDGNSQVLLGDLFIEQNTTTDHHHKNYWGPFYVRLPAGATLDVKYQVSTTNTPRDLDFAVYTFS